MHAQFSTIIAATILIGGATLLAGCNTTAGAGKDLSAAGEAVTSSAKKNTP